MARSKSTEGIVPAAPFLSFDTLSHLLLSETAKPSPHNHGTVSMLVQRPEVNERTVVDSAYLSIAGGMEGSGWVERAERGKVDQICVMPTASIRAIAGEDEGRWPPAGDQMFLDMDLSKGNLKAGDRVKVGAEVVLEVTEKAHNGCAKFAKRYGMDALKVVNCGGGREKRLRGIYFCVVKEGLVRKGDEVVKIGEDGV